MIGPLQLLLIKMEDEQRTGPIGQELTAVRKKGIIRLVDMLYVTRDMEGNLQSKELSDLSPAQRTEYGTILQGLLGMRAAYTSDADVDEIAKALSLTQNDFGISSEQVQGIAGDVPNGGSAMLVLFEHVWAVNLKRAILNAGGEVVAQGLLDPTALALGGTTLADALDAAYKIEEDAEQAAAAEMAEADQKLADAEAQAEAKLAEAQRILDEAQAQATAKLEEADSIAAANIAASVRMAADNLPPEAGDDPDAGDEAQEGE